jgi:hypothetical protein
MTNTAGVRNRSPILLFLTPRVYFGLLFSAPAQSGQLSDIEYVIQVSVDGVNATMLAAELAANPPGASDTTTDYDNWHRFVDEGTSTFNARADYTHTWTLPNHTSMLTGRPTLQPSGQPNTVHHNYTNNGEPGAGTTLHNNHPNVSYISGAFDVAHDNGLSTAHFSSKTKFIIYNQTWEDNGGADVTGPDNGTNKIDYTKIEDSNHFSGSIVDAWNMHQDFLTKMGANTYEYVFLHYVDPDKSGHGYGWGTSQYYTTLQQVDDYLKDVFNLVETNGTLAGKTAIILTADHGGGLPADFKSHGCDTCEEHYDIPFFAWGPGIEADTDLYALNTGVRVNPGSGRPDYNASPQPIWNGGGGNLALQLLGLPAIPGSQINSSQNLVLGTCVVDADCDDLNACSDDVCDQGECSNANNTAPCDDGDACTDGDVCAGGSCASGGPLACDDANGCTDNGCNPASGCEYANNADPCDDGDACTDGDVCAGGSCASGGPLACDDANGCTDNGCNPASGCEYTNNTNSCNDGDACTSNDTCGGGSCQAGGPTDCDDADECTADSCDQLLGCAHDPIPPCGSAIPSASAGGRMLTALLLLSAGALFLVQRRRLSS